MGWQQWVKSVLGVEPSTPMAPQIGAWRGWYTATDPWYSSTERADDGRTYKVERISIKPAKMVCQEWASLILNEKTMIASGDEAADKWLDDWLARTRFLTNGQQLIERMFGVGTAAWALRFHGVRVSSAGLMQPSPGARIVPQRFDANHIIPLSYDEDDCTECLFVSDVTVSGRDFTQLQIHRREPSGYVIETVLFDEKGRLAEVDGIAPILDTRVDVPLFALTRPGLDNTYWEYSPFGVSVFDDALGAVKLVDASIDNMFRDVWLSQKMLFLDDRMLAKDASGNVVVPRERDQQLFRQAELDGQNKLIEEYNPQLRTEENRQALITGLQTLGLRAGLGNEYFSLEGASGLMTATQVVASESDLFRTIRKHENQIGPAIERTALGALAMADRLGAPSLASVDSVTVTFDDSVIEDTASQRKRDLDEVASGLMQPWEFRTRWYGEDEATAKRMAPGFELPPEE